VITQAITIPASALIAALFNYVVTYLSAWTPAVGDTRPNPTE
jgi:hypothetical protein